MTETRGEAIEPAKTVEAIETVGAGKNGKENKCEYPKKLTQVLGIWYPITFQKKCVPVSVHFNSSSKVNAIYPTFVKELSLSIRPTDVRVQKIDRSKLNTFRMVVAAF